MDFYRLDFDVGGSVELTDLDQLKAMRELSPGTIVAVSRQWSVTNDRDLQKFDFPEPAEGRVVELSNEQFQLQTWDVMVDPQPEGLN